MKNKSNISRELIKDAMAYKEYKTLIKELIKDNKVTGDFLKNSTWIVKYTKDNIKRMNRAEEAFEPTKELKDLISADSKKYVWLVITEGWCGDAAQIIPSFVQLAALNSNITIRFILRDQHPEVMDHFLNDGARGIPKLVVLDEETLNEIGVWGPRPAIAQKMTMDYKESGSKDLDSYVVKLHEWYDKNRSADVQNELLDCLTKWTKE